MELLQRIMAGVVILFYSILLFEVFVCVCAFPRKHTQVKVDVCVYVCEVCHCLLHVYGGLTGLFLPSWVPDLPAMIRFHQSWMAHRTVTTHFSSGLNWGLIPAVPAHSWISKKKKKKRESFLYGWISYLYFLK